MKSRGKPNLCSAMLFVGLLGAMVRPEARGQGFDLSITASPEPLIAGRTFLYNIGITNQTGAVQTQIFVTNTVSSTVTLLEATNFFGSVFGSGNTVVFQVEQLGTGAGAGMTLAARADAFGAITNTATILAEGVNTTTEFVNQVYTGMADLAVDLQGPAGGVLVDDWIFYSLSVTNLGSGSAPNVVLTNPLPAGFRLIGVSPTNNAVSFANDALSFRLGTMVNGARTNYQVRVQPTNAGTFTLTANVSAAGLLDTNSANDTASSEIVVDDFLFGQLMATPVSAQVYNPQTGLMEQTIQLSNVGTNDVAAARVFVDNFTNWVYNAVGTNNGLPFVVYANALLGGQSVNLVLEYFIPSRTATNNPTLTARAVPLPIISVPTNTAPNITKVVMLSSGGVLIEFASVTNVSYTILYSDDMEFTAPRVAQPPVIAPADRTQWIDSGPPKTISVPMDATMRFYRVILTP